MRLRSGFSVVKLATEKATGRQFACKIMALPPIGARASDHDSTRCPLMCAAGSGPGPGSGLESGLWSGSGLGSAYLAP